MDLAWAAVVYGIRVEWRFLFAGALWGVQGAFLLMARAPTIRMSILIDVAAVLAAPAFAGTSLGFAAALGSVAALSLLATIPAMRGASP